MLYKSRDYALAFNDNATEIPEGLWRGTEIEGYFDLPPAWRPKRASKRNVAPAPVAPAPKGDAAGE